VDEDGKMAALCHVKARRCCSDSIDWSRRFFGDGKMEGSCLSRLGRRAVGDKRLHILSGHNT
jgi:hypothetical protein